MLPMASPRSEGRVWRKATENFEYFVSLRTVNKEKQSKTNLSKEYLSLAMAFKVKTLKKGTLGLLSKG